MFRAACSPKLFLLLIVFSAAGPVQAQPSGPVTSDSAPQGAVASGSGQQEKHVASQRQSGTPTKKIGIVLFDEFETLDVFGPVQMWGRMRGYEIVIVSQDGGPVRSSQGITTQSTYSFRTAPQLDILMVPGGTGTRAEVGNPAMLDFIRRQDKATEWTTSVCTGSALLAKAGILDGRSATTNKIGFDWATSQSTAVKWQGRARWVVDGKYMTSSGVSAGTDMALALVEKVHGRKAAQEAAQLAEYSWNDDPDNDPFATPQKTGASGHR
jgi:putative intracellular protease/amidase